MRRFLVRFIRPDSFVHTRSSAGFTITTSEFEFSVHTGPNMAVFEQDKSASPESAQAEWTLVSS
jgi:hypothetical protein